MTNAIDVRDLRKSYPGKPAAKVVLDGLDLAVPTGSVTALLGPNGAGKTTTVHILSTLLRPDGGTAIVDGHDVVKEPDAVRAAIGLTGQFSAIDTILTGEQNLMLMAKLRHLGDRAAKARVAELLEQFDLVEAARKPLATYSGGMTRRLDLAMTLVATPRILFLDEPTTGLDPRSRHTMWDIVRGIVADGTTVLLTTQYLDEADELADRVAVLDQGRLVAEGTPVELKRRVSAEKGGGGHLRLEFPDQRALDAAAALFDGAKKDDAAFALEVPAEDGVRDVRAALDRLDRAGIEVADLSIHTPDLDDVFFALTGRAPAEAAVTEGTAP